MSKVSRIANLCFFIITGYVHTGFAQQKIRTIDLSHKNASSAFRQDTGSSQRELPVIEKEFIRIKVSENFTNKFQNTARSLSGSLVTGDRDFDAVSERYEIIEARRVFPHAAKFEKAHEKFGLHLWYEVRLGLRGKETDTQELLEVFKNIPGVSHAEPRYNFKIDAASQKRIANRQLLVFDEPNDPNYQFQWHYENTGKTGGTPGADIRLPHAWTQSTGSKDIIVSIHDGGVDVKHEDLTGNIWVNEAEKNGLQNVDDDNNGYIDDVNGYNFVNHTSTLFPNDHGTHVAGTVGAATNNWIGVAGVAGGSGNNDGVRLMSMAIFTDVSQGGFEESFVYAADNGAVISQNSWGGGAETPQSLIDAIDYFIARAGYDNSEENFELNIQTGPMAGGIVIFAAGNYQPGQNTDEEFVSYPGALPQVVSVANTDDKDEKHFSSYYNDYVDISAPGAEILSTLPGNHYGYLTGTSMACPHVSGTAALILSKFKNDGITPVQLRERLLTTTTDISAKPANEPYEGKIGTGRLNAFHALLTEDAVPPHAITDLASTYHDAVSVILNWTAPGEDEVSAAAYYDVRYSTVPLSDENFETAMQFANPPLPGLEGTSDQLVISGLNPNTTYYFGIRSRDYFGNESSLSNVVIVETSPAPSVAVSPASVEVAVNLANGITEEAITVSNTGTALLEYDVVPAPLGGKKMFYGLDNVNSPEETGFIGLGGPGFHAASKFMVPEGGFSLSRIQGFYRTENVSQPIVKMSIIKGGSSPAGGTLLVEINLTNTSTQGQWHYFELNEAIDFEAGETFWIQYEYPDGIEHPQGMDDVTASAGTFLVSTNGVSYDDIQSLEGFSLAQFKVRVSDGAQWLTVEEGSGAINQGEQKDHTLQFNNSILVNGEYNTYVEVLSNDPRQSRVEVPVHVLVTGGAPELDLPENAIDFGQVFVTGTQTKTLKIINAGHAALEVSAITIDPEAIFTTQTNEITIPALSEVEIFIQFSPQALGESTSTLTIHSDDLDESNTEVILSGTGIPAPQLRIEPSVIAAQAAAGETITAQLIVRNEGGSPLQFSFEEPQSLSGEDPETGYNWIDSREASGPAFRWNDITGTGTAVSISDDGAVRIDLPFVFPFYGEEHAAVTISANGFLTFNDDTGEGASRSTLIPDNAPPDNIIAPLWVDLDPNKNEASIHYFAQQDKFTVQYTKVPVSGQGLHGTATFQVVLYPDGKIEFFYLDVEQFPLLFETVIGIENQTGESGLQISFSDGFYLINELAVKILPHKAKWLESITPVSGTINAIGESVITFTLNATELIAGVYNQNLVLNSNDPLAEQIQIFTELTVTGNPVAEINPGEIVFEKVFTGTSAYKEVTVTNTGKATLTVVSAELSTLESFSLSESMEFIDIYPGHSHKLQVMYSPIAENDDSGILTLTTNAGTIDIPLSGHAVTPPAIAISTGVLAASVTPGNSTDLTFTIRNDGTSDLEYSIGSIQTDHESSGGSKELGYFWIDNHHPNGPEFFWEDLKGADGVITFRLQDDSFKELNLPFRFRFFNKFFDKVYITDNGLIGFDPEKLNYSWNHRKLPATTGSIHNFLAPFWFDFTPNPEAKVYIKRTPEKVVIQYINARQAISVLDFYIEYFNTFQVILYPDGTIQYLYNKIETDNSGTIGIENSDGSEGITVSYNSDYLHEGHIVQITPTSQLLESVTPLNGTLAPGNSQEISVKVTVPADFVAANHQESLIITSNDPLRDHINIPVNVEVPGMSWLETNEELDFGEIGVYSASSAVLSVRNTGNKAFMLQEISISENLFTSRFAGPMVISPGTTYSIQIDFEGSDEKGIKTGVLTLLTDINDGNDGSFQVTLPVKATVVDPANISVTPLNFAWNLSEQESISDFLLIRSITGGNFTYDLQPFPYSSNPDDYEHEGTSLQALPGGKVGFANTNKRDLSEEEMIDLSEFDWIGENIQEETDAFLGTENYLEGKTSVAAKFTVEQKSFALTHVLDYYRMEYGNDLNVKLIIAFGGETPEESMVIYEQIFSDEEAVNLSGKYSIIELNRTLHFKENDIFWVIIEYPGAAGRTQGVNFDAGQTIGDYFYYDSKLGRWIDSNVLDEGVAFKISALQKEINWIIIPNRTGTVLSQSEQNIELTINGMDMPIGTYEAKIKINGNYNLELFAYATASIVTGMEGDINAAGLEFYPNPVKDEATIEFETTSENHARIEVIATNGNVLSRFDEDILAGGKQQFKLDTRSFSPGVYLIRLTVGSKTYASKFIVKR